MLRRNGKEAFAQFMPLPVRPVPTPPADLLNAARRLLRPLVRLMIRSGITFPVLADVLRRLFVEVAADDILDQPRARSDSRISLLTGVHRKEIRRLRETPVEGAAEPEVVTISSQVIARWLANEPFADARGPRPLLRTAVPGSAEPSFEALVASVTTDIRARVVLDDWLVQDIVRMNAAERIELNVDAFIPRPGCAEQLFYFARNLHDHVAAAVANISADGTAPFLDRSVHYDGLTPDQAHELSAYAKSAAVRLLLDVNRKALALLQAAPGGEAPTYADQPPRRVNLGIFVFDADDTARTEPSPGARVGDAPGLDTARRAP
jgi:hypothetical protein